MTAVALERTQFRVQASTLLPVVVFLLVTFVAWWASAPYVVGVFHDDGVYALVAKSIATGHGFHYIALPGGPAATHQPPLYPLLLGAAWWLAPSFPDNISVLLGVNALLLGAAALGFYLFTTAHLGWRRDVAAVGAMLTAITAPTLLLASTLFSEPLFLAVLWPALVLAERATTDEGAGAPALAGVTIGALMLVRTHGIALLVALVLVLLVRRRWSHAAIAAGAAIAVLIPWQLWTMRAAPVPAPLEGAFGSYLGWYVTGLREGGVPFLAATARTNLREFWLILLDRVAVGPFAWLRIAAGLLAALMVVGAWSMARRALVTVLFSICFLGIVLIWPYIPWRFVWAIWPLLLLFAIEGARAIIGRARSSRIRASLAAVIAFPVLAMIGTEYTAYRERSWLRPAQQTGEQIKTVVRWVATHTRPDDIVLTEGAEVVSLFTGRRATPTASFTAREYLVAPDTSRARVQLRAMLDVVPARYVIALLPLTQQSARALSAARPGLREIDALPQAGALVFEVVR